ncbi:glycosyltransferase [Coprococcus comes]|uniref:glycosyltransferase n=1 Tax=Coprococcus comes TaxID=410072 RepID=UPI002ED3D26F
MLVIENNSQKKKTFKDYRRIMHEYSKVKVLYWKGEGFNYPEINQYGIDHATGEYLLFLNNDTEMIGSDCIKEMLSYCMREDVGAVGARMYYEDGTLQHGGVIIGLGGVAGHAFLGIDGDSPGYFARAQVIHDLSAVTAACMMMKKRVYEEVGGFDSKFAVAFNDVDLCLKIRKAGYLIVYDPYAELIHYESKSRGYEDTEEKIERFHGEVNLFQTRWKDFLKKGDPYYSPNLTLDHNDFGLNHLAKVERR